MGSYQRWGKRRGQLPGPVKLWLITLLPVQSLMRPYWLALLAEALAKEGDVQEGINVLAKAEAIVETSGERLCEAELHRLMGELLLSVSASNFAQGEACFQRALDTARRQRAKSFELRAALSLSRLWKGQGKDQASLPIACEGLQLVHRGL